MFEKSYDGVFFVYSTAVSSSEEPVGLHEIYIPSPTVPDEFGPLEFKNNDPPVVGNGNGCIICPNVLRVPLLNGIANKIPRILTLSFDVSIKFSDFY